EKGGNHVPQERLGRRVPADASPVGKGGLTCLLHREPVFRRPSSTAKASLTFAFYSVPRPPATLADRLQTSTPLICSIVFDASATALATASSQLFGDSPTSSKTLIVVMTNPPRKFS